MWIVSATRSANSLLLLLEDLFWGVLHPLVSKWCSLALRLIEYGVGRVVLHDHLIGGLHLFVR